jgi:hypothetical protein
MSVFDKLKAYSRKPAAVILATVMATSTIPTTPIAQAVTAAYAESTTAQPAKGAETEPVTVDPASLVNKNVHWNGQDELMLNFSSHIKDGSSSATIVKSDVIGMVNNAFQGEAYDSAFAYTAGGDDAVSKAIDESLAREAEKLAKNNKDDEKETVAYDNVAVNGDIARKVVGCDYDIIAPEGVKVTKEKDGSISIEGNAPVENAQIKLKVKSVTVDLSFNYTYKKTTTPKSTSATETTVSENKDAKSDDVTNGGTPTPTPTPAPAKSTEETLDGNHKLYASLEDRTVDCGAGTEVLSGAITNREYFSGAADALKAAENVDAAGLVYKTPHADYAVLSGSWQGLKGELENAEANKEFFDADLMTSTAAFEQKVKITPKKAFEDEKTFTITWKYPNGDPAGTTTVHVRGIAQKDLDLASVTAENQVDFRMATDQDSYLLKAANAAAEKAVDATQTGDKITDLYTSASIKESDYSEYYTNGKKYAENKLDGTRLSLKKSDDDILANYNIIGQPTVVVKPMVSKAWSDDTDLTKRLSLAGTGLKAETFTSPSKTWIKTNATAKWQGGKLADTRGGLSAETKFVESTDDTNRGGQGKMENSFYVQDNDDKIVREITGTSYLYDNVVPGLTSFKAVPDTSKFKDFKSSDNKVWAAENMKVQFYTTEGDNTKDDENPCASGINKVEGTYTEQSSKGKSEEKPIPGTAFDKTKDKYGYEFSLSADSKVRSDQIHVTLTDNAGNKSKELGYGDALLDGKKNTNIDVEELAATTSAPTISTSWNTTAASNGKYYNVNRTLTVTIHAPFFEYTQAYLSGDVFATVTKNGGSYRTLTPSDFKSQGNDTWVATVDFTEDGDYEVSNVNVQDILGRGSTADGDTFTIDKTAPKLNVSWNTEAAQNGKYYNAARTATITVEEHNFDPNLFKIEAPVSAGNGDEATPAQIGGWSSNGDTHTATVTFPGQGVYTLSVSGEDLASNKSESYTSPEFVIDTIKPKIDIQNVVNRTAYAGEVAPTAAVHDTNLADGTSIEVSKISYPLSKDDPNPYAGAAINTSATDKSVSYLNPAKTKGNDGVYTLTVQAIDLAGNTESEAVTWSVNRFGSTYVISDNTGKMLDQYLKSSKTTDVKVTEINPSGLDDNKTSVELTRDTKNTTLKSGDNYTTDSDTSSGWSEYNYTVSKSNYDKDGAYRVLFHSEDAAGNSSENTMEGKNAKKSGAAAEINFAVDDTAPIASFVDLASNGKYEESSHKAKVSFEDNLKLSKAQIKVNGKTVATFTADQLEKSPIREFTLDGNSSKQDVTVVAWDAAGNKSKELKATGVLVTNDSFVLWMNNLPLMVGTIVAIVVVAGGIYMVVAKKRKENEEK